MNRIVCLFVMLASLTAFSYHANAQLWKRIKSEVKSRAVNHVVNDAGNVTDKAIDKTEDAVFNTVKEDNTNDQNNSVSKLTSQQQTPKPSDTETGTTINTALAPALSTIVSYKNYDFISGDRILFETNFNSQRDAELPARLGILHGNAEIQTYEKEKVLHVNKGDNVCIIPLIDSADYLPGQFTVEFDLLYKNPDPQSFNQVEIDFYKSNKNNDYMVANYGDYHFLIYEADQIDFGKSIQGNRLSKPVINALEMPNTWHHIAMYVHNNIGKAYIDQYRVGASNMMKKGAAKLAIKTNGRMEYMIRNLRIAGGGSDAYHKIMTEGKLVTHGIHFASGKSDIRPESMGTINEVYKILKNHADLKFEIDGYTDNNGSADLNLKLSKERADAVKKQLTIMGIDASRMATKGFGEQKAIDSNDTPEGKANNRRVEFVKE